jgi:ankyrin repeat protein
MSDLIELHKAYERGDLDAVKAGMGNPPDFPNCRGHQAVGEIVLEYAIYHSPLAFIRTLLELGADPNYGDHAGFPSLIATLTCADRADMYEILELLLAHGADIQQHGHNDYTPLHWAVADGNIKAVEFLLAHGADPNARTRIDDCATPLEEAEILGLTDMAAALRKLTAAR